MEVRFAALISPLTLHTVFITEAAVRRIDLLGGVSNDGQFPPSTLKPTTRT
jgi:hypothetical protein